MCDVDIEARRQRRRRAEHLRHPQGAALARASTPTSSAGSACRSATSTGRLGRAAAPGARPRARRRDRPGRQVHRPARRLPLGHRGAARRRLPPRRQGASSAGSPATSARPEAGAQQALGGVDAICVPGASACAASRASSARCAGPASTRCRRSASASGCSAWSSSTPATSPASPTPRRASSTPTRRTRSSRRWRSRRRYRRGRRRPRRHDAPGPLPGRPDRGLARRARPTARPRSTSATGTATRSTTPTATQLEEAGLVFSGTSPDGTLVEFVELPARRAPVLRRRPRRTRSSSRARTAPTRCSPGWSGPPSSAAGDPAGRGRAPRAATVAAP